MGRFVTRRPVKAFFVDSRDLESARKWIGKDARIEDGRLLVEGVDVPDEVPCPRPDGLLDVPQDRWLVCWGDGQLMWMTDAGFKSMFKHDGGKPKPKPKLGLVGPGE
jgi:hypothetical protein